MSFRLALCEATFALATQSIARFIIIIIIIIFVAFKESMTLNVAQRSFKVIHFGGNRVIIITEQELL